MQDYIIKRKLIVGGERRVESRKSLKCKNSVIFQPIKAKVKNMGQKRLKMSDLS